MKTLLSMVLLASASPALAITLCTTPDGKTYAGDNPPAGCAVKTKLENSAAPPAPSTEEIRAAVESGVSDAIDDAKRKQETTVMASAVKQRRAIEREIDRLEDELSGVNGKLHNVVAVNPANYRDTTAGWQKYKQDLQDMYAYESNLRSKKTDLEIALRSERSKFDRLTQEVKVANGGVLPASWGPIR